MTPIPELSDPDRSQIQEAVESMNEIAQAFTELMDAFVEAIRPVLDAIVEFVERVIETVKRWQVFAVLMRFGVPADWAAWVSEHIPRFALPPLSFPVMNWCLGIPLAKGHLRP